MTDASHPMLLAGLALGYLLGSIPFGLILTRMAGLGDVRAIGSGNIGATNVLRTGRKGLAAATLLLDALKGTAAVLLAERLLGPEPALAAALGAFLGHTFPVWLGFRGGKGVATYIGVLVALDWRAALVFALVWLAVAAASRYSSLSSLVASAITPLALWWLGRGDAALLIGLLAVILWFKHRSNIARLMAGTEGRIGQKG
ncbi:MAG TPA: glycerol-3-phosphate 1-O-acyltransferase PlsY [Methylobacterium sp.]|jgi:glycerol-3-phosphate acyltransferase PlsY|nr:glycerol-3-phosphate 1-O-acyltransferase PlsY [Methylobacterium sp.]